MRGILAGRILGSVDIGFLALWFVCGLGTAVLATIAPPTRTAFAAAGGAFVLGVWWSRQPFAPTTPAVAVVVGVVAAAALIRPGRRAYTLAAAGLLAGIWTAVLQVQGLPPVAATVAAGALPVISSLLARRRPAFAPAALQEEALLFLVILGLVAAAAPGIADGWRAAGSLNVQASGPDIAEPVVIPTWTLTVASAALLMGGLFSLWSRR